MSVETTKPLEIPRISAEISNDVNDLRMRAIRGDQITVEEYAAGIRKLRELFGARVAAKQVAAPKAKTATRAKKKEVLSDEAVEDLLKGL